MNINLTGARSRWLYSLCVVITHYLDKGVKRTFPGLLSCSVYTHTHIYSTYAFCSAPLVYPGHFLADWHLAVEVQVDLCLASTDTNHQILLIDQRVMGLSLKISYRNVHFKQLLKVFFSCVSQERNMFEGVKCREVLFITF